MAPKSRTSWMNFSGWTIIKCTSNGLLHIFATDFITGKPKEILGTNTPSITSRCNQSASLRFIISISLLRSLKSAAKRDGATIVFIILCRVNQLRQYDTVLPFNLIVRYVYAICLIMLSVLSLGCNCSCVNLLIGFLHF